MTEQKTTLIFEAKPKGFAETQRAIEGVNKAATGGGPGGQAKTGKDTESSLNKMVGSFDKLGKSGRAIDMMAASMAKLNKVIGTDLVRSIGRLQAVFERMDTMAERLGGGGGGSGGNSGGGGGGGSAPGSSRRASSEANRSGMVQGVLEGLLSGNLSHMIQRGPGAFAQAGGVMLGQGARAAGAFASNLAMAPLHGAAGLQTALSGIPVLGGLLASQVGQVSDAASYHRTLQGAAPLLGMGFVPGARNAAMASGADAGAGAYSMPLSAVRDGLNAAAGSRHSMVGGALSSVVNRATGALDLGSEKSQRDRLAGILRRRQAQEADERANPGAAGRERAAKASATARMASVGKNQLGLSLPESLQFYTSLAAGSGGTSGTLGAMAPGFDQTAARTERQYGVGPMISGTFAKAQMQDGLAGSGGGAGAMLKRTLRDAIANGLEGSDLQRYMADVAQGIEQFATTGIRVAPESLQSMATGLRGSGSMSLERAQGAAGNMLQATRGLADQGPSTGSEAFLLSRLLSPGGKDMTPERIYEGRKELAERGTIDGQSPFDRLRSSMRESYTGMVGPNSADPQARAAGKEEIYRQYGRMLGLSRSESESLADPSADSASAARQRGINDKLIKRIAPGAAVDVDKPAMGSENADSLLRNMAAMQNQGIANGERFSDVAVKLNSTMLELTDSIGKTLAPAIGDIVDQSLRFGRELMPIVSKLGDTVSHLAEIVAHPGRLFGMGSASAVGPH